MARETTGNQKSDIHFASRTRMCVRRKDGWTSVPSVPTSPLRFPAWPLRHPTSGLRLSKCSHYQPHLGRRIRAGTGRTAQSGKSVTQIGTKVYPVFQFAEGSLRTKIGTIDSVRPYVRMTKESIVDSYDLYFIKSNYKSWYYQTYKRK